MPGSSPSLQEFADPVVSDLSGYSADQLDDVAAELNARPRQTLGWLTPSEAFARAVAMTD
jgi:IS30 family transposase